MSACQTIPTRADSNQVRSECPLYPIVPTHFLIDQINLSDRKKLKILHQ